MAESSASANAVVRQAFLKIDEEVTLSAVDSLDLRAHAKVSAVVGVPLRQLQQKRDVVNFATSSPVLALKGLLELIANAPLEKIIEVLGDHADTPTYEQMASAVDEILASGSTDDEVVALLCFAIGESFPAAPHCRRLLEERDEFKLPELPDIAPPTVLAPAREVSAEVREQRKARREEEKRKKKTAPTSRPPKPPKAKDPSPKKVVVPPTNSPTPPPLVEEQRRNLLTPLESAGFNAGHPLVGSVVIVEVPFNATDAEQPDVTAKERPALIVGVSDTEVLVRALYSNDSPSRQIFAPWRRLGLDHVSYIDDEKIVVTPDSLTALRPLGQITVTDWNSLSL